MKARIISSLAMLPLILVLFAGGLVLKATILVISIMAVREFYKAFHTGGIYPFMGIGIGSAFVLYGINLLELPDIYVLFWLFCCTVASILPVFNLKRHTLEEVQVTLLGIVYIIFFAYHIVLIGDLTGYKIFIWMIFITAFVTDIAAYFSGYFLGKHKLCPEISPKKTVEGAIGGTLICVLVSGLFGYYFVEEFFVACLVMGLLGSIAGQLGDLTASVIKRKLGIKDYSQLIPGHGGVLDRIDSVLFTAPVIYYLILVMNI